MHPRVNASGRNDVDHARVAMSTTATSAKEKCLPVLQANQDVFRILPPIDSVILLGLKPYCIQINS